MALTERAVQCHQGQLSTLKRGLCHTSPMRTRQTLPRCMNTPCAPVHATAAKDWAPHLLQGFKKPPLQRVCWQRILGHAPSWGEKMKEARHRYATRFLSLGSEKRSPPVLSYYLVGLHYINNCFLLCYVLLCYVTLNYVALCRMMS